VCVGVEHRSGFVLCVRGNPVESWYLVVNLFAEDFRGGDALCADAHDLQQHEHQDRGRNHEHDTHLCLRWTSLIASAV